MTAIPQHADPKMKLYQNSYIHRINHTYSRHSKPTETVMTTEFKTTLHRRARKCKFQPARSTQSPHKAHQRVKIPQ